MCRRFTPRGWAAGSARSRRPATVTFGVCSSKPLGPTVILRAERCHMRRSLEGQPEEIQAISWKGQVRLCGRHRRMIARGKHPNKVTIAIARELLAFLWATARMVKPMSPAA